MVIFGREKPIINKTGITWTTSWQTCARTLSNHNVRDNTNYESCQDSRWDQPAYHSQCDLSHLDVWPPLLMLSSLVANSVHELYAMSYPSPAKSYLLTYNMMRMKHHRPLLDTKPGHDTLAPTLPPCISFGITKRLMREKNISTNAASRGMKNFVSKMPTNVSNSPYPNYLT